MITGIEHVAVLAKDTKRLADWYVRVFGFEIVNENDKNEYFVRASDGSMMEIIPCEGEVFPTGIHEWGFRHIALSVPGDKFDAAVEELRKEKVEVVVDVSISPTGVKTFLFRDIEGNLFHLLYRPMPF